MERCPKCGKVLTLSDHETYCDDNGDLTYGVICTNCGYNEFGTEMKTPCDYGPCPYDAEYSEHCRVYCGLGVDE